MENKYTRKIYDKSPMLLKSMFASLYGAQKKWTRFRGEYKEWFAYFENNSFLDYNSLLDLQNAKLQEFLSMAYNKVPFYKDIFKKNKLTLCDIKSQEDLVKLPLLEKSDLIRLGSKLLNNDIKNKIVWKQTSGSTGKPMRIPWIASVEQMEWAFVWARARKGVSMGDSNSSFTGLELLVPSKNKPPFWVNNWANQQRMFSIFHMNDSNMWEYVKALESGYNRYISGYGSSVYVLADFILRNNIKISHKPKAFFNASEELLPSYKETIMKAFGCEVWNHYGQVELAGSITQYECGHLHYDMDYSILEFLPVSIEANGEIVAEVIATNINNPMWPLIRYKTGDLVVYHPDDKCDLMPGKVIRRIHGRTGRYFLLPDGRRITNVSVIAKKCNNLKLMQVIQNVPGEILVNVVKDQKFSIVDEEKIYHEFQTKLGTDLSVRLNYVNDIKRTSAGKYISIINNLKL